MQMSQVKFALSLALLIISSSCFAQVRAFTDSEERVLQAYVAYYGRPADAGGLAYWAGRLEEVEGWPLTIAVEEKEQAGQGTQDDNELYRVKKMRFGGAARSPDKTTIKYNDCITVEGVPLDAYKYIVNGKSAIEWVMERYQVTQHKDSRIINDPNKWSDDPRYIIELLQKVVTVSMRTVEIVSGLPELEKAE